MKESPLSEITLRKYEKPYELKKRELAKKVCLSLGLLQPADSRDIVVDILLALLEASKNKKELNSDEIKQQVIKLRQEASLELKGIAESNIRRQLKKLRDLFIVEKQNNLYKITEFLSLKEIFEKKIQNFYIPEITERIKDYLEEIEK
jgi:predicted transcriptional regulator